MKKRSRAGKRFRRIFFLILFLAAAGAVFYFGFYQFQMPADTYGVVFTKYTGSGWKNDVLKPGQLRFEWEGLLPVNLEIEKFRLLPAESRISVSGVLPSADVYSLYLEGSPDFSFIFSFDASYVIKEDSLPQLITDEFLRENNMDQWLAEFDKELSAEAYDFVRRKAEDSVYMERISYDYSMLEDDLIKEMSAKHENISFIRFIPVKAVFPDLALYAEGKRQYFEVEKVQNNIQKAALDETTARVAEEAAKLELLEKYGAVFSKYPVLLQYYSIFNSGDGAVLPEIELPSAIKPKTE